MTTPPPVTLIRGLTLVAAVSIIIANVVGTGVFLKARVMTCNVGTPGMVVTVWVVAGLLSLAGALTYAELAAMAQGHGCGAGRYWKHKPDLERFNRAKDGAPGEATEPEPESKPRTRRSPTRCPNRRPKRSTHATG